MHKITNIAKIITVGYFKSFLKTTLEYWLTIFLSYFVSKMIKTTSFIQNSKNVLLMVKINSLNNSRMQETPTLPTDSDSSTDTIKSNPILNTSLYLGLHARTMHKSILEHLLVLKAPHGDDPQVQSGSHPCFLGFLQG